MYLLWLMVYSCASYAQVFRIGEEEKYSLPSEVAEIATNGAVIEINAGEYLGDTAVWHQNSLTIRGVNGVAHLRAEGKSADNKAIWVFKGKDIVVENIEFSGATVKDKNGAGIRFEGENLIVRNSKFHHNENGILAGNNLNSSIVIEKSIFTNNGYGDGYSHNLYVGYIKKLDVRYSYFSNANVGHQIKSRAKNNFILYNRVSDEEIGKSSYLVDIPNGGSFYLIGNVLQQGKLAENRIAVSYATQNLEKFSPNIVAISNNTFINNKNNGIFIRLDVKPVSSSISNNIFFGKGKVVRGNIMMNNNLITNNKNIFCDYNAYNYRIKKVIPSYAVEKYQLIGNVDLLPMFEYKHIANYINRELSNRVSVGAHEYIGGKCE